MMCAAHAGPGTLVVDHAKAPGEKIRISGGGRCNFTNMQTSPANFISQNKHFCKSALKRYTQWDFIALVDQYRIAWHEKTLGQLFCDDTAKDIVAMLRAEMDKAGAQLWLQTQVGEIGHDGHDYRVSLDRNGTKVDVIARRSRTGGVWSKVGRALGSADWPSGCAGAASADPKAVSKARVKTTATQQKMAAATAMPSFPILRIRRLRSQPHFQSLLPKYPAELRRRRGQTVMCGRF